MEAQAGPPESANRGLRGGIERVALGAVTTLIGVNLWSGFPLLALWVGSQLAGSTGLSSGAVFAVLVVLAACEGVGLFLLGTLSARYDRITGRDPGPRQPLPWMRSMRAERAGLRRKGRQLNALERIVIALVVVAVIGFEIWFFFLAGSSLPNAG